MTLTKKKLQEKRDKRGGKRIYDPNIIIEQLLEWSKNEESINFCNFCYEKGYLPSLIWSLEQENQDFADAYMLVRMKLAERRERYANDQTLNYGSYQRYQKGYDPFLEKAEDIDADKTAKRRKNVLDTERLNLFTLVKMASNGDIKQED